MKRIDREELEHEFVEDTSIVIREVLHTVYGMKYDDHESGDKCLSYIVSELSSDKSEALKKLSKHRYSCHLWFPQELTRLLGDQVSDRGSENRYQEPDGKGAECNESKHKPGRGAMIKKKREKIVCCELGHRVYFLYG